MIFKLHNKGVAEEEHGPALALSAGKLLSGCHLILIIGHYN